MNRKLHLALALIAPAAFTLSGCGAEFRDWRRASASPRETDLALTGNEEILSAFFGADDVPPGGALAACGLPLTMRIDGLPVTFRREIDQTTLSPGDFNVTLADGEVVTPLCATTAPASEENEDRTILLGGQFGNEANPPMTVTTVGELWSEASEELGSINLAGQAAAVIPLAAGPAIVLAERIAAAELETTPGTSSIAAACPSTTTQAVRITWQGGVTRNGRQEITDIQRRKYRVTVTNAQGVTTSVTPFAIGDLNDQDNIQDLCLNASGTPVSVQVPAGTVTDPIGDPNPDVDVPVDAS